ncbi:hypothetical protein [uncultured Alsobacter sp.]|uniref:hypothetical protein n=1 Tax=uncultured Alsobacter sp. TaxID=1748258 RepID=UPI0025E2E772|nr:hypothetical protein [uncultured Alsobacter sp.]
MNWNSLVILPGKRVRVLAGVWEGKIAVVRQNLGHGILAIALEREPDAVRVYDATELRAVGWEPKPLRILMAEGGLIGIISVGFWEAMWWMIGP